MRKLDKPDFKVEEVYLECISIVRNPDLKARLTACKDLIVEAEKEFDEKILNKSAHTITRESIINENVTKKELEKVYTSRMVPKEKPGRIYYDKLKVAPAHGICPLCSHREVKQLDHYLPKTLYPRLTVTPLNLTPSCSECNSIKKTSFPTCVEEEMMHPYYDDIESDIWLVARVEHTTPPSISFDVEPPIAWDTVLKDRVEYHFETLELNDLYSIQAGVVLANINLRLVKIHADSGSDGVKNYLLEEAESRCQINKNSWQTAMYTAIYNDTWFCDNGFLMP